MALTDIATYRQWYLLLIVVTVNITDDNRTYSQWHLS